MTPDRHPYASPREAVRTLDPGSFAVVMATGIVSVDLQQHRLPHVSAAVLWLGALCYLALVALHVWRLLAFPASMRADLANPSRGFGFFTFVAGTNVLGARLAADGHFGLGVGLLTVGGIGWLVLGYAIPAAVLPGGADRSGVAAANGTWFVWVVATQSVAVLAASLEPATSTGRRELALLAVVCWSVGVALYIAVAIFVAARLILHRPRPADLRQRRTSSARSSSSRPTPGSSSGTTQTQTGSRITSRASWLSGRHHQPRRSRIDGRFGPEGEVLPWAYRPIQPADMVLSSTLSTSRSGGVKLQSTRQRAK